MIKVKLKDIPKGKDTEKTPFSDNTYTELYNLLKDIFVTHINYVYHSAKLPVLQYTFLSVCEMLERTAFLPQTEIPRVIINLYKDAFIEIPAKAYIRVQLIKKETWNDYPEGVTPLTGMEVNFTQNSHHFIKIYLQEKNKLMIHTNQILTWDTLYKLKRMQLSLFEDCYQSINPELKNFYEALAFYQIEKAETALNKLLDNPILEEIRYDYLKEYFSSAKDKLLKQKEIKIQETREIIEDIQNRLAKAFHEQEELLLVYNTLLQQPDQFDFKDIINYITKNPYITKISRVNSDTLQLDYHAPLLYYDMNALDILLKRTTGVQRVILKVLQRQEYTLWTHCSLRYIPHLFTIKALKNYICAPDKLPHPHIDQFGCLGNHVQAIQDWAETHDYIGCLDQITAAVLNLNLTDTVVLQRLYQMLMSKPNRKCFKHNETGEFVSLNEIITKEDYND